MSLLFKVLTVNRKWLHRACRNLLDPLVQKRKWVKKLTRVELDEDSRLKVKWLNLWNRGVYKKVMSTAWVEINRGDPRDVVSVSHSVIDWTFFKMTDNILFFLWLKYPKMTDPFWWNLWKRLTKNFFSYITVILNLHLVC